MIESQIALVESNDGDREKELDYRLLGNAHEDVLTAFEAALKVAFRQLAAMKTDDGDEPPSPPTPNVFQNIIKGAKTYRRIGIELYESLDDIQLKSLSDHVQRRHVIGHNLGIADDLFTQHTDSGRVGQTVSIVAEDIRAFGGLCRQVVKHVDQCLAWTDVTYDVKSS